MQNIENIEFQEFFLRRISHLLVSCLQRWKGLTEARGEFRDQVAECQTEEEIKKAKETRRKQSGGLRRRRRRRWQEGEVVFYVAGRLFVP